MTASLTYTDTHTITHSYGDAWYPISVSPPPAFHPVQMDLSVNAAVTATLIANMVQAGGSRPGFHLLDGSVSAGATTGTVTGTQVIDANATGFNINLSMSNPTTVPVTIVTTIVVTFSDLQPPPPCAYGTRASASAGTIAVITDVALTAALTLFGAPWLAYLFAPLVGYAIQTGSVCKSLPPPVPQFQPTDLLATIEQKAAWLNSIMWWSLCECVPAPTGSPPPIAPVPPVLTQPPTFPVPPTYPCSNTDPCTTLIYILKRIDEINLSTQINFNSTSTIVTNNPPAIAFPKLAYTAGATHALTGSGTVSVSGLVGIRVEVTSTPPSHQLPGVPAYYWDQGWMSVSDGGALLMERRIARLSSEWFPPEMDLATVFGFYLNPGVTARMTELLPA